jgi:meso-butanediol dehydrogenase / (S,S)-butanediol dehydrogenase / diacetyl reductase
VTLNEFPGDEAAGAPASQRRLERRVALVTGGGSGAGAAIARHCASLGASVIVADIDYALAGEVAASIRATGTAALAHRCDVAVEDQVISLVDRVAREFGGLDLVFNVAGPWLDGDVLGHWSRIVSTNLLGTMHVTRHAIELLKRRGGAVVNVAADSGMGFGAEDRPAYCAAKAGVLRLTAALRSLQTQKIRVNCIAPDVISSPEDFAVAAVSLALREECAGRVALYRTGKAIQLVDYGDPGYRQAHTAPW